MRIPEVNTGGADDAMWQHVLARYPRALVPASVHALGNRGGFSGAGIWRVVTAQGDFALRRWPDSGLPRERILGLHRLLAHLQREGLPFVAVPLPTSDGTTLPNVAGRDWQLEPWMPGTADYHSRSSPEQLRAAMAALAQWHRAAERHVPADAAAEWFYSRASARSPAVSERLRILERMNEPEFHRREAAIGLVPQVPLRERLNRVLELVRCGKSRIHDELNAVQNTVVRLHPCLRDVWHDHLLFVGDRVTGIIDPSASRTEHVSSDLSRLIGSLVGDDRGRWELALAEYRTLRPLSAAEIVLVEVLDRSGVLLSGWTWLDWVCVQQRPFADTAAVLSRLDTLLKRMEGLVDSLQFRKVIRP